MNLWDYIKVGFFCILMLCGIVLVLYGLQAIVIDTGRAIVH